MTIEFKEHWLQIETNLEAGLGGKPSGSLPWPHLPLGSLFCIPFQPCWPLFSFPYFLDSLHHQTFCRRPLPLPGNFFTFTSPGWSHVSLTSHMSSFSPTRSKPFVMMLSGPSYFYLQHSSWLQLYLFGGYLSSSLDYKVMFLFPCLIFLTGAFSVPVQLLAWMNK